MGKASQQASSVTGTSAPPQPPVPAARVRWIDELLPSEAQQREYAEDRAVLVLTDRIAALMEAANVSRAELASRMGVSRGRITKLLAQGNMNLKTLGRVLFALDAEISDVEIIPFGTAPATATGPHDGWHLLAEGTVASQDRRGPVQRVPVSEVGVR